MPRDTGQHKIRMQGVALDIYLDTRYLHTHAHHGVDTADPGPGAAQCVVELRGSGSIAPTPTCSPANQVAGGWARRQPGESLSSKMQ